MKDYIKPTLEVVELRTEERLSAGCTMHGNDCTLQGPGNASNKS